MTEHSDPIRELENSLRELHNVVNLNDQRVTQALKNLDDIVDELKQESKNYVHKESFGIYEKAFWVLGGAMVSMLSGLSIFLLTR